jgi:hypothetical protein
MDIFVALVGGAIVILTMSDLFQSVIVPRPVSARRPSAIVTRFAWRLVGRLTQGIQNAERREDILGFFAPGLLVVLFILWVVALILGFGAIFYAMRGQLHPVPAGYWGAVYYAGTSFLTLGYGDVTAVSAAARALSLTAAALGLGTFATVIAFLFTIVGAYQRREAFILALRERTGAPPSGLQLLTALAHLEMLDTIPATFREAETWMSELMETHLAYPPLVYFRSTHDEQSWVGTVGAMLDASSLIVTTVDGGPVGPARLLNRLGRHLVGDFDRFYDVVDDPQPGIEREEFVQAYRQLAAAGLALRPLETAWRDFAELRASYAGPLNSMATWFRIPPAQWIGDRSLLHTRHAPAPPVPMGIRDSVPDADVPSRSV